MNAHEDAIEAYEAANARAKMLREEWEGIGSPILSEGSMGQPVPHPIWKLMHEAEVIADRLRQHVQKKHRGPEPRAVVTPLAAKRIKRKSA